MYSGVEIIVQFENNPKMAFQIDQTVTICSRQQGVLEQDGQTSGRKHDGSELDEHVRRSTVHFKSMNQAYFYDEELETMAILCRGKDRLVLAFRGTARIENLMTDLKFHQARTLVIPTISTNTVAIAVVWTGGTLRGGFCCFPPLVTFSLRAESSTSTTVVQ